MKGWTLIAPIALRRRRNENTDELKRPKGRPGAVAALRTTIQKRLYQRTHRRPPSVCQSVFGRTPARCLAAAGVDISEIAMALKRAFSRR